MNKQKLAVTLWNFKGGVGKSTIALSLAEIAAAQNLRVLAIDLDEQHSLSHALRLAAPHFRNIDVRLSLDTSFADENFDFFVIDSHPAKDELVKEAFAFSDFILVPVLSDYLSVLNLRSSIDYITNSGIALPQVAIVKNCFSSLKLSNEVETVLEAQGYVAAGSLPRSNILSRNIASGLRWDKFMPARQREPFLRLHDSLWRAYRRLLDGFSHNLWRN